MKLRDRAAAQELALRRQLNEAGLTRRELKKLGLLIGGGVLLRPRTSAASHNDGGSGVSGSPPTRPWLERMPVPPVLSPGSSFSPAGAHQYFTRFPPRKFYRMAARESPHSFHPDLPPSTVWGYNGVSPGPTLDARYGEPVLLRVTNELPTDTKGFGPPQVMTHLHNFHTAPESDGGPWNWTNPGGSTDHHYTLARAGFSVPETIPAEFRDASGGDVRESLTTLFYHQHRPDFTSAGVYKGLVGFCRIFDDKDTGDETTGWRLPSGPYDVPLAFADKRFDPTTGALFFDHFAVDGFLGHKHTVNGKIQPFFEVKRRKYRFRVLNVGPSRFYAFVLRYNSANQPFHQLTESGNFLEAPRTNLTKLEVWPAERFDIVVDFSRFPVGATVHLSNVLAMQSDGAGPDRSTSLNPDEVANQVLQFRVLGDAVTDASRIPTQFRPFPLVNLNEAVKRRTWKFDRQNGMWTINGELWDPDIDHSPDFLSNPRNQVKRNTAEVWVLEGSWGRWEHPVHIHFEEGQVLKINGSTPSRKTRTDMYRMGRNTTIELFMRFRDFPEPGFAGATRAGERGRYVMHCHNTVHEDHAMMATWNVVP